MSNNSNAIDMLNDRLNAADSKRFCESNNSKSIAHNQSNEKRKYQKNKIKNSNTKPYERMTIIGRNV